MRNFVRGAVIASVLLVAACAGGPSPVVLENAGYDVAASWVAAQLAKPSTSPAEAAKLKGLLAAAQAALLTYQNTAAPNDLTALNAAVAAIVAYETQQPAPAPAKVGG